MRQIPGIRVSVGVLMCGIFACGCNRAPTAPSPSAATLPTSGNGESVVIAQAAGLSLHDLQARGWDCRPAPFNPVRVTCSHPNQLHPVGLPGPPPPADRPASITLLVFDSGAFLGTSLLIRSDLYNGQQCQSTNGPYTFIARIGYYECLHRSQAG